MAPRSSSRMLGSAARAGLLLPLALLLSLSAAPPTLAAADAPPMERYLLARHDDRAGESNTACLGSSFRAARAFVDAWEADTGSPQALEGEEENRVTADNFADVARIFYVGNSDTLGATGLLCASDSSAFLFNGSRLMSTGGRPLPGTASNYSLVASIWTADPESTVDLDVLNLVDQSWKLNFTAMPDPVVPPFATRHFFVNNTHLNSSKLIGRAMLEAFAGKALLSASATIDDEAGNSTTHAVALLDERSGVALHYFYALKPAGSALCGSDSQGPCLIGKSLEAVYDVSGVDFLTLHCLYAGEGEGCGGPGSGSRRRLLSRGSRELRVLEHALRGRMLDLYASAGATGGTTNCKWWNGRPVCN